MGFDLFFLAAGPLETGANPVAVLFRAGLTGIAFQSCRRRSGSDRKMWLEIIDRAERCVRCRTVTMVSVALVAR